MKNLTKKILQAITKTVIIVAAILLLWWLLSVLTNNQLVLPMPWEVIKLTCELLLIKETYAALLYTLLRALAAFSLSAVVALALTLLVGVCGKTKPFVDGVVNFFRSLPTIAVILLTMIAFQSNTVPVVVAFLVAFPVIYSAFQRETVDSQLDELGKVYNISASKKVSYILLPQVGKGVLPQCKDTIPLCIKVVIAGEVLALPRIGLGHEMYVAKVNLLTANVVALTLLALAVCFAISGVFCCLQRRAK